MKKNIWNTKNFTSNKIFNQEIVGFFSPGNFVGVKQMINGNNFFVPDYFSKKYIITKTENYNLLNNICLHKNARLVEDGNEFKKNKFTCPIHFWSYNLDGNLISAPCSNVDCKKENLTIKTSIPLYEHDIFLFSNENLIKEIKNSKFLKDFKFSDYILQEVSSYEQTGNWKEYGIVFNDSNHVKFFHPEMTEVLDSNSIEWEISDNYVAHRMKSSKNWKTKINNRFTNYFNELISNDISISNDGINDYVVTWVNILPNVFLDIWSQQIVITFIEPTELSKYKIHNIWLVHNKLIEKNTLLKTFMDIMNQVEDEDNIIINRIHDGILSNRNNKTLTEYIISPSENGNIDFYEWLKNNGPFYK